MLERNLRPVSPTLAIRAAKRLTIPPTALPFTGKRPAFYEDALDALGYPASLTSETSPA